MVAWRISDSISDVPRWVGDAQLRMNLPLGRALEVNATLVGVSGGVPGGFSQSGGGWRLLN